MKKFTEFMEIKISPIAGKVGTQRHMMSIKDAFIAMLPVTLAGSFAVLLNVFLRDIPTELGFTSFVEAMQPIINLNGMIWWGSLAIMALVFTFAYGYSLAKNSEIDPLPAGIVALAAYFVTTTQNAEFIPEGATEAVSAWGYVPIGNLDATSLFTAILIVTIAMEIFIFLTKRKITIKMPEQVPPGVAKAFTAIIPGIISMYAIAIFSASVLAITGMTINELIATFIMTPLMHLSQGYFAVMLLTFLSQILWFFGIHGMNILMPVYESLFTTATLANAQAAQAGEAIPYIWGRASFDIYGMMGGGGATLSLIISMFIVGKRAETKQIRALSTVPGIFNINEPLVFGVPIVFNPIYFIPFIVAPLVGVTIGYISTAIGFADPVVVAIPWVTPAILNAFLATAGSIGAVITSIICLIVTVIIYLPFVRISERQMDKLYGKEE